MSVMKNNQQAYASFCLLSLICFWLSSFMGEINIASLNINGAREGKKRFHLFELVKRKLMFYLFKRLTAMS